MSVLKRDHGLTLIELLSSLAIAALILASLYLLVGSTLKGRMIVHARVSDQERARQAMAWLADRTRQVNYDSTRACPEGFLRVGNGDGFDQRLAFRAVLENPTRQTYVYYVDGPVGQQILWQETRSQETPGLCADETTRTDIDPNRIALTPPIVQPGGIDCPDELNAQPPWRFLCYLDEDGVPTSEPTLVHSLLITITVQAEAASGQFELQTFQTVASVRGP